MALYYFYRNELQTQVMLIKSKPVAKRLVETIGAERLGLREGLLEPEKLALAFYGAKPVKETRFIDITSLATDPELAAEIANAVADGHIEESLQRQRKLINETIDAYSRRVPERLKELEAAEAELLKFREEHGIVSSDKPEEALRRQELNLVEQLSQARQERMSYQSRLRAQSADGVIGKPHKDIARGLAGEDAWVRQLFERRLAQKTLLSELTKSYSEGHPKLDSAMVAMAEIEGDLDAAARSYYERLQLKYNAAVWKESDTERLLTEHRKHVAALSKQLSKYENLRQRRDSLRALLEPLARSQAELKVAANLGLSNASIIERASSPAGPSEPSLFKHLLAGFGLGFVLSLVLIRLLEAFDESVRTPDDLTRAAPVKVPGMVSKITRKVAGNDGARALATVGRSDSITAEQFRSLRISILPSKPEQERSSVGVVLVTSPGLSEGKTTICLNMGQVFAQLGKPVVIVDADLRRPKGHSLMDVPQSPGVVEVLKGKCELGQAIRELPIPNLFLLPAGRSTSSPAELVASDGMKKLLNDLRQQYGTVFVDSPPVVPVADARSLASMADMVLLVVRSGRTGRRALTRTYDLLGAGEGTPILAILNGVPSSVSKDYGYGDRRYDSYYRTRDSGGNVSGCKG